jgi:hypothetical protein
LEKTWVVMCPNWKKAEHVNKAQGWALYKNALEKVGNDYLNPKIDCIMCKKKFSLQQGVSEAFASDVAINNFRYNSDESGKVAIKIGQLKRVVFTQPFEDTPIVYLTPYLKPVHAVPSDINSSGFSILSCSVNDEQGIRHLTWHAVGNRAYERTPIWRQLLTNTKEHQQRKNYRAEIVELESAFEVFFSEYLAKNLRTRLRQETIDWLLTKQRIEGQMAIGYRELTGQAITTQYPKEHGRWQNCVKEVRDRILHQGMEITSEQAIEARKAMFNYLTRIDNSTMEHFQIQMNNIGTDGPLMTFGTATVKRTRTQQTVQHGFKKRDK